LRGSACDIRKEDTFLTLNPHSVSPLHFLGVRRIFGEVCCVNNLVIKYLSGILLITWIIGEFFGSYPEYPAKSVGKLGEEFLIAALAKS
jgi:hypothetical protein